MRPIEEAIQVLYPGIDERLCRNVVTSVDKQVVEYREALGLSEDVHVHLVYLHRCFLCDAKIMYLKDGLTHDEPDPMHTEDYYNGDEAVDEVDAVPGDPCPVCGRGLREHDAVAIISCGRVMDAQREEERSLVRGKLNEWAVWIFLTALLVVTLCGVVFFRTA